MENEYIKKMQSSLLFAYKGIINEINTQTDIIQLRPKLTPNLASYFTGDIDFMIKSKDFKIVLSIIYKYCKNHRINFYLDQKSVNKKRFEFFIENHDQTCLILEFWTAVEITENNERKSLNVASIFKAIKDKKICKEEVLALIYITHLHHKNKNIFSEENKYRFKVFIDDLEKDTIAIILTELKRNNITLEEANKKALLLLDQFGLKKQSSFKFKCNLYEKKVSQKFWNVKNITPILGPDGVGKGSISDKALSELKNWKPHRFKQLYRLKKIYKLRLIFMPNWRSQPKNKLDERLSYYIFITASISFQLLRLLNKQNILLDRYFLDYFGTPIRYIKTGKKPEKIKLYRFMMTLTPTPNKMVFLGCKNESLKERKNELDDDSVEFLQKIYIDFITSKNINKMLFISTENNINSSSNNLYEFLNKK